ncbi:AraC family transcriptional regulator [Paenibacillus sp. BAC0078]
MENVRVYEIPACKMVSSECGMFGDGKLEKFDEWFSKQPKTMFPEDFLWMDKQRGGFVWYYIYHEGMDVPADFEIVDFPGGLYAVATEVDGKDSTEVINSIKAFISSRACFEEDPTREYLGNIPTPQSAIQAMGYGQMDYFVPIRITESTGVEMKR